jgi:hypothetical protein
MVNSENDTYYGSSRRMGHKKVDYTNVFAQSEMKETLYIEPPKLLAAKSGKDMVLLLLKSLYGLKQAPIKFYEKLRD